MIEALLHYHWEIFITLEILATVSLLLFLVFRYALKKQSISYFFLIIFFMLLGTEVILAVVVYRETGEISTFTIVVTIFLLYALTFGISDFQKLDRYIKQKVGKWKNVDLLTEKDKQRMERAKNPKVIARNYFLWWLTHFGVFIGGHAYFWVTYGKHDEGIMHFLTDWSWYAAETTDEGPFHDEIIGSVSQLWILIFVIDSIVSWSYILFPGGEKQSD